MVPDTRPCLGHLYEYLKLDGARLVFYKTLGLSFPRTSYNVSSYIYIMCPLI